MAILHFGAGFFGIPNDPEQHGVYVERHQVTGQGFFGAKWRGIHALVNAQRAEFEQRNGKKQARTRKAIEAAQAHDHHALPIHAHVHRREHNEPYQHGNDDPRKRQSAESRSK